jgi:hypothetical protein
MRHTLFSLAALATLALAACNGSSTDTVPGEARFDGVIGSGTRAEDDTTSTGDDGVIGSGTRSSADTGTGFLGGGTRAEGDTTSRDGGGTIGSGT